MKEKLKIYIDQHMNYINKNYNIMLGASAKKMIYEENDLCCFNCEASSLNDYLNNNNTKNKFQTLLFKYIDDKNLKDSDVYNKVHIDRRLFSKIRSDDEYHPSKETILLLGLSLELSEDEIEKLLDSASYSLPKNNYYDLIIRFCFKNKIYNLKSVNDLLDEYKCKLFNY